MEIYLFLDVDGVLNSFDNPGLEKSSFGLRPIHLRALQILIDEFHPKIILSSCWRVSLRRIRQLENAGVKIFDTTPIIWQNRPLEIKVWKERNMKPEDWGIVLDDEHVFKEPQEHLIEVNTKLQTGLRRIDALKFIEIIKKTMGA